MMKTKRKIILSRSELASLLPLKEGDKVIAMDVNFDPNFLQVVVEGEFDSVPDYDDNPYSEYSEIPLIPLHKNYNNQGSSTGPHLHFDS